MKTNKVLVLIEATPKGGRIIFRALQDWQTVLAEREIDISAHDLVFQGETVSADYAKVIATIKALKHLAAKLPPNTPAPYEVILVQPSLTVQRWLSNPESHTVFLVGGLQLVVDESVRIASQIPSRSGSAVYHLLGACSGLLQMMSVILQYQAPQETSPYNYAAEKFQRALRDIRYAISDLLVVRTLPPFFQNAHDRLRELLGD